MNELTKNIIQIVVVVISLSFLTEIFYFGGRIPFFGTSTTSVAKNTSGTTSFNGTIRTYDPVLILPSNTSKSVIDALRKKDNVLNVNTDQGEYLVQTETRDDVYPLAAYLRSLNVTSYAVANVVIPQTIVVLTPDGVVNATASGVVRVMSEPFLDVDSQIPITMNVTLDSTGYLVDYASPMVINQPVEAVLSATILRLDYKTYSYVIPWENRTMPGNLSRYGIVEYKPVDSMVFNPQLTSAQVMAKKGFDYIRYVDPGSALVEPGFSNTTQLALNFKDVNYTLPPSKLVIKANASLAGEGEPDVPFNASVLYSYTLLLNDGGSAGTGYDFGSAPLSLQADREYADNQSVNVSISAIALGNKIILVRSVSIPS